jgi:GNAT superfamily N-acetyltransferase
VAPPGNQAATEKTNITSKVYEDPGLLNKIRVNKGVIMIREEIRPITSEELALVTTWAEAEGWNPGKHDAESYYVSDPNGFFVFLVDDKPVASMAAVRYSSTFSFIGYLIVSPEYRWKGYAIKIWQAAMNYLQDCHSIGLYAVLRKVTCYKKFGFNRCHSIRRLQKVIYHQDFPKKILSTRLNKTCDVNDLLEYDRSVFEGCRKNFLGAILRMPDTYCSIIRNSEGIINGYGIARPCQRGYRIGPLYAMIQDDAQLIVQHLAIQLPEKEMLILDIPESNRNFLEFKTNLMMEHIKHCDTEAMFKNEMPDKMRLTQDQCYAVASLEVG